MAREKGEEGGEKDGWQVRRETGGCARVGRTDGEGRLRSRLAGRREVGQAEKLLGPLGRDVAGCRTDHIRRGGRTGADPFRDLQYPKRLERRAVIGVERDEPGKRGCRGLPR